jgi:putative Mg2+ transporter-C (MgtC) family protein
MRSTDEAEAAKYPRLWSVAGIGLAVGGGMYTAAVGATVIIFIILAGVKPLERRFIAVK